LLTHPGTEEDALHPASHGDVPGDLGHGAFATCV
jgi:hypothetical protein